MSDKEIQIKANSYRDKLFRDFSNQTNRSKEKLAKFANDIVNSDPQFHMEWADSAFLAAAEHSVAQQIVSCLVHYEKIKDIREILEDNVRNLARYVFNKSTSPSKNYAEECRLHALQTALDTLRHVKDLEADYFAK